MAKFGVNNSAMAKMEMFAFSDSVREYRIYFVNNC